MFTKILKKKKVRRYQVNLYFNEKLFKEYYNSKDMRPPNFGLDLPSVDFIKRLRKPFNPRPGAHLFPRWRLKKLKDNPFDANGQLCEKYDT